MPPAAPESEPEPRPARAGATARLIAGAAALGVVVGVCAGYTVQAGRDPEPPALAQPSLPQARGSEPTPASAAEDRKSRTDGDLRELLLEKPGGATTPDWVDPQGWADLEAYTDGADDPDQAAAELAGREFLRAAVTGWYADGHEVEIWLAQYGRNKAPTAPADDSGSARYWAETDPDVRSRPVAGTGEGMAYTHPEPDDTHQYTAEAHAWRGALTAHIWIRADSPISLDTVTDLAERQMERL
ncbi:hypothetical protein ABZ330_31335 [Streptomyces sp. NPDC006172]|uniref:hypothetical protein n=1 Tax=Streptomyces sp. NPDC006172 TaxID=3154470 RepID=UPI003408A0F2